MSKTFAALVAVVLSLVGPEAAAPAAARPQAAPALVTEVLTAPRPVAGTGRRTHLAYEILLRNDGAEPVRLDQVQVRHSHVLATLGGSAIEPRLFSAAGGNTRTLPPGGLGLLILDVTLAPRARPPARLHHRFTVTVGAGETRTTTLTGARTDVDRRQPRSLRPPLKGGELAIFGCCDRPFGHRQALFNLDGRWRLAQRYAIDVAQLDGDLSSFAGDPTRNENYFIYGDDITAVAPGRVLAARDGVPENTPPNPPSNPGVDDLTGNFVFQSLGGGDFALYAHMKRGSVRVRAGDRVRAGQVIGQVGNTGNSTEPHLHFHVTDGPGQPYGLDSDGVPYVFDRFRLTARIGGLDVNPPAPVRLPAPAPHRRAGQYPLTGDIVSFG